MESDDNGKILAERLIAKGALHGSAETKVVLPFKNTDLFYLVIMPIDERFCVIQLKTNGINNPQSYRYYQRPKVVIKKEPTPEKGKNLLKFTDYVSKENKDSVRI